MSKSGEAFEKLTYEEIRSMTLKEVFDFLLKHKEYQRRWKGGLQILFGFSPDELEVLKCGVMPTNEKK